MIDPSWERICGIHLDPDGLLGAVWLAHDKSSSVVHVYDVAKFRKEAFAIIVEGLGARGRRIPIAWRKKDKAFADKLLESGLDIIPEPVVEDDAVAEVISREIWQRLRTSRFRVDRRVGEWLEEYRTFYQDDLKIPDTGFPLMSATRYAVEMLPYARAETPAGRGKPNYPKLAVV